MEMKKVIVWRASIALVVVTSAADSLAGSRHSIAQTAAVLTTCQLKTSYQCAVTVRPRSQAAGYDAPLFCCFQRCSFPADSAHAARRPTGRHVASARLRRLYPSAGACHWWLCVVPYLICSLSAQLLTVRAAAIRTRDEQLSINSTQQLLPRSITSAVYSQ